MSTAAKSERPLGRPPRPPEEKQSAALSVRFTPDERAAVEDAAAAASTTAAAWCRERILASLRRQRARAS